jgi:hypothetical protein
MGEPVTVIEKPSNNHGVVRFETNRWFTGMGHERYTAGQPIHRHRPADRLASLLLGTGRAEEVHVYGQSVTVKLLPGCNAEGFKALIEDLYTYYRPGVEVPDPETFGAAAG